MRGNKEYCCDKPRTRIYEFTKDDVTAFKQYDALICERSKNLLNK